MSKAASIHVLGIEIHMVEIPGIVSQMEYWIKYKNDVCHHVVNSGMHGVMAAQKNSSIRTIFKSVDLFAPDGIAMIFLARIRGFKINKKNTGPDVLLEFARKASNHGYSVYFYGDSETVLEKLVSRLTNEFPGLKIAGYRSPPFRELTPEEDADDIAAINAAAPDVLWVGLGMPKQEQWISEHQKRLHVPVAVGAGAAFKMLSGEISRGPEWLRNLGFEWSWRLIHEPMNIWKRVFIDAPWFIYLVALELTGLRKFE